MNSSNYVSTPQKMTNTSLKTQACAFIGTPDFRSAGTNWHICFIPSATAFRQLMATHSISTAIRCYRLCLGWAQSSKS